MGAHDSGICGNIPDNSIRPLTEFFCNSVSLINNEVLVEDLEDLPSLKV